MYKYVTPFLFLCNFLLTAVNIEFLKKKKRMSFFHLFVSFLKNTQPYMHTEALYLCPVLDRMTPGAGETLGHGHHMMQQRLEELARLSEYIKRARCGSAALPCAVLCPPRGEFISRPCSPDITLPPPRPTTTFQPHTIEAIN